MIFKQIQLAFDAKLGLDQTYHGVRRIKLGKHGSRSSLFYSRKNGGFIPVESRLELRHCYQLESDPDVQQYRSQAIAVLRGTRRLVPDFLVACADGKFMVDEVKVSSGLTEKQKSKLQFLAGVFAAHDITYRVVTEQNFPVFQVEQNRVMLYDRGGRLSASDLQIERVYSLAHAVPRADRTVCRVRLELKTAGLPAYLLEHALFKGALGCDLTRAISSDSLVEVSA